MILKMQKVWERLQTWEANDSGRLGVEVMVLRMFGRIHLLSNWIMVNVLHGHKQNSKTNTCRCC